MTRRWRGALIGAGAGVAVFALGRVGCDRLAAAKLHAFVEARAMHVDETRAKLHASRLPSLRDAPAAVSCSRAQAELLGGATYAGPAPRFAATLHVWPGTHVPSDARGFVRTHAEDLDALRATLACNQDRDEKIGVSRGLHVRQAVDQLVIEGLVHAEDDDLEGAIDRELDAVRLAEELGPVGSTSALTDATIALARVVAGSGGRASLDRVDRGLDALAPFFPTASSLLEDERLLIVDAAREADPDPVGKLGAPRYDSIPGTQKAKMRLLTLLLPPRAIRAQAIFTLDDQIARGIAAAQSGSAARTRETSDAIAAENERTWNPIVWRTGIPISVEYARELGRPACALAVARAVVAIERSRDAMGRYGSTPMPEDPCARGTPLRFESLGGGAGYRVWSVGANGVDDRGASSPLRGEGHPDDLSAQR